MSPRTPKPLLAGIVTLCVGATLGIVSCTRGERDLGDSLSGDGGGGGSLAPPDAGIKPDANDFLSLCKSSTCPLPYATCPNDTFECETNFDSDNANCGACGVKCPQGQDILSTFRAEWFCQSGKCQMQCDPIEKTADCNHDVADGCESNLCDSDNCGTCGNKCPAGVGCFQGNCGCPPGFTGCGDCVFGACVNLENNDRNCGACGRECPTEPLPTFPHTIFGCVDSECGKVKCDFGWKDCNSDLPKDGCEIDTASDPLNCGGCGRQCAPGQTCLHGKCECQPSQTLCHIPEYGEDYCADLATDIFNCGACRHECPYLDGIVSVCNRGRCELQCPNGYADCDGRPENGCETHVAGDPRNCGACGTQCDLGYGQPCVGGVCLMAPCSSGGAQ